MSMLIQQEDENAVLVRRWFEGLEQGHVDGQDICDYWGTLTQNQHNHLKDLPNPKDPSKNRSLHYAAILNNPDLVERLFTAAADFTCTNKLGSTALHIAAVSGSVDALKALQKYKPKNIWEVQNKIGNTILHCAALSGNIDVFETLYADCSDKQEFRQALKNPNFASYTPGMYANIYDDLAMFLKDLLG